jgi:hypothetical protein
MIWSHNEQWMMTGDDQGYIKYWQANMNNVKMFQGHLDAIRGLRYKQNYCNNVVPRIMIVTISHFTAFALNLFYKLLIYWLNIRKFFFFLTNEFYKYHMDFC